METLILVEEYHIGDLFRYPQIVRAFCESNPTLRVEMATYTSFCLFQGVARDVPNLHVVDIRTHPLRGQIVEATPGSFVCRKHDDVYILNLFGLQRFAVAAGRYLECHYLNVYTTMQLAVEHANTVWGTSYSMRPCTDPLSLIPCIPDTDCSLFDAWRVKNTNLCILYYNFQPCSGQSIGISWNAHERVLYALCVRFPDATILVPMFSDALKSATWRPHNLLSCEESFGCAVTPDCENLCMLAKIETRCDVSVHFDIGACFYYAGSTFYDTNCKILHASRDHFYYHRLKENFRMSDEEYAKKAVPVLATKNTGAFIQRLIQEIESLPPRLSLQQL